MTTIASPPNSRPVGQSSRVGAYDRLFYSGMAIAMALTVFAGFAPSYYLRAAFGGPRTVGAQDLTPLLHLHGALFSGWVLLFIAQTALAASRRVAVHRRLGVAVALLAAAMLVVGVTAALDAVHRITPPDGVDPRSFLIIPLGDMALFATFVSAALWLRSRKEAHKRLMLLAYVSILVAAVARLPGMAALGPPAFFGVTFLFVLAGVTYDLVTRRRVHPAYIWGGLLILVSVPLRLWISGTQAWLAIADFLVP
jgi:hypothetical protein